MEFSEIEKAYFAFRNIECNRFQSPDLDRLMVTLDDGVRRYRYFLALIAEKHRRTAAEFHDVTYRRMLEKAKGADDPFAMEEGYKLFHIVQLELEAYYLFCKHLVGQTRSAV